VLENQAELIARTLSGADGSGVPNGSFEIGSEADTAPSGWDLSIAAGNSTAFECETSNVGHGRQSFKMTTGGGITGGVVLTSGDFRAVGEGEALMLSWFMKSSVATIANKVVALWYDVSKNYLSATTVYDNSTTNETDMRQYEYAISAPVNARFLKLEFTGVNNSTLGSVWYDGIKLETAVCILSKKAMFLESGTWECPGGVRFVNLKMWGGGSSGTDSSHSSTFPGSGGDTWFKDSSIRARGAVPTTTPEGTWYLYKPFSSGFLRGFGAQNATGSYGAGSYGPNAGGGLGYKGVFIANGAGGIAYDCDPNTGAMGGCRGAAIYGGAGEYVEAVLVPVVPGTVYTVNIGAGGTVPVGIVASDGGSGLLIIEY
jgi:hypothetical protein